MASESDEMMGVRRNTMSLTVLLCAAGTLVLFTGAAFALFAQPAGVHNVRPIVTDRRVIGSGAFIDAESTRPDRVSTASGPAAQVQAAGTTPAGVAKPASTKAAGTKEAGPSSSGAAGTPRKTSPASAASSARADTGDKPEGEHEVVVPGVRDEERSDDEDLTSPYEPRGSWSGAKEDPR